MKRILALSLLFSLLLFFGACGLVNNCGPFDTKFKTTGFESEAQRVEFESTSDPTPELFPIEDDTLLYNSFGIAMNPITKTYASSQERSGSFRFVSPAYACSPPPLTSDEIIRDIQIYSDKNFSSEYAAGDDLADLFDVVVFESRAGSRRLDLHDFLAEAPNAVKRIILVLKSAPQTASSFQFTVKYFQEGKGVNYYEFETEAVTLRPD